MGARLRLEEITFSYYLDILRDEDFLRSLAVSLGVAAGSALLAAVLGTAVCAALTVRGAPEGSSPMSCGSPSWYPTRWWPCSPS